MIVLLKDEEQNSILISAPEDDRPPHFPGTQLECPRVWRPE